MQCCGMGAHNCRAYTCYGHPFTLEGLQCTLAKQVVKKEPVTVDILKAVIQDARSSGQLSNLRLATVCLIAFAGFLHLSISAPVT